MYLQKFLTTVGLCLLAYNNVVIASPLHDIQSHEIIARNPLEKRVSNLAFESDKLRFGIEVETILELREGSLAYEQLNPLLRQYIESKFLDLNEHNTLEIMEQFLKLLRDVVVGVWKKYEVDPAKSESISRWLREMIKSGKPQPQRPEMVDRFLEKDKSTRTYWDWSITKDVSIDSRNPWRFPIEFVSPIFEIGPKEDDYYQARYQIEVFFDFLQNFGFKIVEHPSTSTHVHVSPLEKDGKWTLDRVVRLTSSAFFFEPSIRCLLPKDRHTNRQAMEFRDPMWYETALGRNKKQAMKNKDGVMDIIGTFFDPPSGKVQTIAQYRHHIYPNIDFYREMSWSLSNLPGAENAAKLAGTENAAKLPGTADVVNLPGTANAVKYKGTIECRRGGQSMNAAQAMFNIELVVGFALASCAEEGNSAVDVLGRYGLNMGSLKSFIRNYKSKFGENSFPELEKRFDELGDRLDVSAEELDYSPKKSDQ